MKILQPYRSLLNPKKIFRSGEILPDEELEMLSTERKNGLMEAGVFGNPNLTTPSVPRQPEPEPEPDDDNGDEDEG